MQLAEFCGLTQSVQVVNGPEFVSKGLDVWEIVSTFSYG